MASSAAWLCPRPYNWGLGPSSRLVPGTPTLARHKALRPRITMSVEEMIGADVETFGLWDPLGFSRDEASLFRRRCVELKHGRVAQLAVVGTVVQETIYRFPDPAFSNTRPVAALQQVWEQQPLVIWGILLVLGVIELTVGRQDYDDKAPGDLCSFGDFAKPVDEEEWERIQLRELKHGRLAMLAIMGQLVQEQLTGHGPVEQIVTSYMAQVSSIGDEASIAAGELVQ